ncbi:unnamed protein product [Caenorhabditis auriculariae]|uniref:small monomeric GTPase n=1 Tax=Caenorhabditis auriculariae TaxID=2777116 RepID=A0A8S1H6B5_9PELO|nr:unnamed protein product [Caenorhabditis auriculariae]
MRFGCVFERVQNVGSSANQRTIARVLRHQRRFGTFYEQCLSFGIGSIACSTCWAWPIKKESWSCANLASNFGAAFTGWHPVHDFLIWAATHKHAACGKITSRQWMRSFFSSIVPIWSESRKVAPNSSLCSRMSRSPRRQFLFWATKIDKANALGEDQLKWQLNVQHLCEVSRNDLASRPLEVFTVSVLRRQGYGDGFRWLSQYI